MNFVEAMTESGSESTSSQPGSSKGQHRRTRTGCITCRIRRVKCDETKPQCLRCVRVGRTCDGYLPESGQISRRELAVVIRQLQVVGPAARVLGGPQPTEDPACFDFFRVKTTSMTESLFPAEFWSRQLLQTAHAEPALWRAAVALGAMHRHAERAEDGGRLRRLGQVHYSEAMTLARSIRDPKTLLVASVAFASLACLIGRFGDSQVHIKAGLSLLKTVRATEGQEETGSDIDSIAQSLARLDLQDMTFEDSQHPYEHIHSADRIPRIRPFSHTGDLAHASTGVLGLLRGFISVSSGFGRGQVPQNEFEAARDRIVDDTLMWETEMKALLEKWEASVPLSRESATHQRLLAIKLYHAMLRLTIEATIDAFPFGLETRWDKYLGYFERIVAIGSCIARAGRMRSNYLLTLEPGVGLPVFIAASRCRHPIIRRRALRVLRALNRQEGLWDTTAAAAIGEQWLLVEEENASYGLPLFLKEPDAHTIKNEILAEAPSSWLGETRQFISTESWEQWQPIPEIDRVLGDSIHAYVDERRIEGSFFLRDAEGQVRARPMAAVYY